MTSTNIAYGSSTSLTVTGLASLANSATVGWQSDKIDNTTTKAVDYLIDLTFPMAAGTPANDKTVYVYVCPAYYDGSSWYYTDGGTATLPSGSNSAYTIGTSSNLFLLKSMQYTTSGQTIQGVLSLSQTFGSTLPHGFSLIIVNYSGIAMAASGVKILVTPITYTSV
jgi:hypothetical protein